MFHLIRNVKVYAPDDLGRKDILVAGKQIVRIAEPGTDYSSVEPHITDGTSLQAFPGIIDAHVHIAGAGGEGGPGTRTPDVGFSQFVEGGITAVVGCLGTDGFTRSLESVLMKVKELRTLGMSAWMYTGSYQVPPPTFFGDPAKDISLIEEVIGVGEVAISDHRSSCPDRNALMRLAAHARLGGMLGGKAGVLNIHMGDAKDPFRPLHDVVSNSELNYNTFYPTHINRNAEIFEDAKAYGMVGYVDITTSSYPFFSDIEIKPSTALRLLLDAGVPLSHITMTSDAGGSLPRFNERGELVSIETGQPKSLLFEVVDAVKEGCDPALAFATVTRNVARILKLQNKGEVAVGADADILLLDEDYALQHVMGLGQWLMFDQKVLKKGLYE